MAFYKDKSAGWDLVIHVPPFKRRCCFKNNKLKIHGSLVEVVRIWLHGNSVAPHFNQHHYKLRFLVLRFNTRSLSIYMFEQRYTNIMLYMDT